MIATIAKVKAYCGTSLPVGSAPIAALDKGRMFNFWIVTIMRAHRA
jgi:hypothetical protein